MVVGEGGGREEDGKGRGGNIRIQLCATDQARKHHDSTGLVPSASASQTPRGATEAAEFNLGSVTRINECRPRPCLAVNENGTEREAEAETEAEAEAEGGSRILSVSLCSCRTNVCCTRCTASGVEGGREAEVGR